MPSSVLSVGEILWDIFPTAKHLGGAPVNFVYHARQLGLDARPISRIGSDALGKELLEVLRAKKIPTDFVQIDPTHDTGTVEVRMNGTEHQFIITENVAWDFIQTEPAVLQAVASAKAICFGSIAQRNPVSRTSILSIVNACPGLKVCDINLRQHFFSREVLENSLRLSNVLKLNIDELFVLKDLFSMIGTLPVDLCQNLLTRFDLSLICVTRGGEGALLVDKNQIVDQPGEKVNLVDTVGCGDAFCAALIHGLLTGKPLKQIAHDASRIGAFVATCSGATPDWPDELKQELVRRP
jgi:fructokinase